MKLAILWPDGKVDHEESKPNWLGYEQYIVDWLEHYPEAIVMVVD